MKLWTPTLGLAALALAGCSFSISGEEEQLENSIRNTLEGQGNVQQVEMTRQDDGSFTGYAMIRDRNGRQGRLNCTARPTEGTNYNWRCLPTIDESVVTEMEGLIRTELERQAATVIEVQMTRQDDNNMAGFALVEDGAGNQIRTNCVATRNPAGTSNFSFRCRQPGAVADSGAPQEQPADEAVPVEEGEKPY